MDQILDAINNLGITEMVIGAVSAAILFGLSKLPAKIKSLFVKVIDKTDSELDKEK
jgi:Sec-independent protein translocase protein TatA